jgi:pimeloyl-ACP methyl ester carboxylesterase
MRGRARPCGLGVEIAHIVRRWDAETSHLGQYRNVPRAEEIPVAEATTTIEAFRVDVPDEELAELRRRIAATRWPTKELVADRSQGVQLATLQALAHYWTTEHDWRKCEARLNALPQFTTEIDGVNIHFIHVRSRHENAFPLIMTHGWPGSVIELLDTIGPLTDPTGHGGTPEDAFHLVLPSLPGYGLSGEPTELGWENGRIARAWAELMKRLGYTRYVAQGGDVGADVTDAMGRQGPEGLVGIHVTLLDAALAIKDQLPAETEQERAALAALKTFLTDGIGYFQEQSTRPQTIGYSLLDSPIGLAAWMLDHDTDSYYKISRAFVDGEPVGNLTRENIVDNITLNWLTGHRRLGRPVVLGAWTVPGRGPGVRPGPSAGQGSGRLHDVPRRGLRCPAQLGRGGPPRPRLLQRGREGRPLRRLGRTATLLRGNARGVRLLAIARSSRRRRSDPRRPPDATKQQPATSSFAATERRSPDTADLGDVLAGDDGEGEAIADARIGLEMVCPAAPYRRL